MTEEFSGVYRTNLTPIWRFVAARVPVDDADDVTSDVFERAAKAWPRYDPARGAVRAWLSGIARHAVADYWRRRRPPPAADPDLDRSDAGNPEELVIGRQDAGRLTLHLGRLTDREREALALRFGAELRPAEVGEALGISEAAAKMLVHRAVVKLREAMSHG